MIIKFYNLGAIKETELDLRPLTVIIGPNNSNKTYIAYSVYGLLQQASRPGSSYSALNFKIVRSHAELDVNEDFIGLISSACANACSRFGDNLEVFYQDSSRSLFAHTRFEIIVSSQEIAEALRKTISKSIYGFDDVARYRAEFVNNVVTIRSEASIGGDASRLSKIEAEAGFLVAFLDELFPKRFLLPAERNSFIITYKMLLNKRFSSLRDREREIFGRRDDEELQRRMLREQGDLRYPQPIEDFLDFLSAVELSHGQRGTAKSGHSNGQHDGGEASAFAAVASQIEKYIQDGNKTAFSPTTLGGSEIMVNVKKGLSIDLYNASSSIKQLAPLLLYLRYRAAENQLLIIDEPEMNLHPESQVRLLEILAILVNAGVKVLLTTHSPYLMSHLNNLTLNDNHSDAIKKKQAGSLYLKDSRAFLTMEQVSAYEMRDNQLKSLKDDDFGIRYDTLSDVSVDVQQKYFEIYEKGKPAKRGKAQTTRNGDVS